MADKARAQDSTPLVDELLNGATNLNPQIIETVEVSPELPSGGTSHCSVST